MLFTSVLALASCTLEEMETVYIDPNAESFDITVGVDDPETIGPHTKSSFTDADLSRISDMNILIYHEGVFLKDYSKYITDLSSIKLTLPGGKDGFNIYLVGNVGEVDAPESESDIDELQYVVSSYNDFRAKGFPVANVYRNYAKGSQTNLKVKRLVGQYNVRIDASATDAEYTVKDLRMINCALDVYPFATDKKATVFGKVISTQTGDILTADDIQKLNAGETVPLYFIENLQGVLLPNNTDRKNKIPSIVGDEYAKYCTYIEITADIQTASAKYTNGKYRFYLGQDETTDFSIRRNTVYNATLDFTQNMVSEEDWRIEVDQPEFVEVYLSEEEVHFSRVHYKNKDVYIYIKDRDITDVYKLTDFKIKDSDGGWLVKPDTDLIDNKVSIKEYKGYKAFCIKGPHLIYKDNLTEEEELDLMVSNYADHKIEIESVETYNGKPLIQKEVKFEYHEPSPLLFKVEKINGSSNYSLVVRGKNPFKEKIKISATYTIRESENSLLTGFSIPSKTVVDINDEPTLIGTFDARVNPTSLAEIDIQVFIDDKPIFTNSSPQWGPRENQYPQLFEKLPEDTEVTIYGENNDYDIITWISTYDENTNKQWNLTGFRVVNSSNNSKCYFKIGKNTLKEAREGYKSDTGFYILNSPLMNYSFISVLTPEIKRYPNKSKWQGGGTFFGTGRDLFFENKEGKIMGNNIHFVTYGINIWKPMIGNKINTQQAVKDYDVEFFLGSIYMSINGCSVWSAPQGINYNAQGYFTDKY